jgi:hypothetical protein
MEANIEARILHVTEEYSDGETSIDEHLMQCTQERQHLWMFHKLEQRQAEHHGTRHAIGSH